MLLSQTQTLHLETLLEGFLLFLTRGGYKEDLIDASIFDSKIKVSFLLNIKDCLIS